MRGLPRSTFLEGNVASSMMDEAVVDTRNQRSSDDEQDGVNEDLKSDKESGVR